MIYVTAYAKALILHSMTLGQGIRKGRERGWQLEDDVNSPLPENRLLINERQPVIQLPPAVLEYDVVPENLLMRSLAASRTR